MIDYANLELYNVDSTYKQIVITYDTGEITNSDLHFESFELEESICSEPDLHFGCCESAKLTFKVRNPFESMKNKDIVVRNILNKDNENPFQIGKYKVYSDVPSADRSHRVVTAYDKLYEIQNEDVTEWYESLFPNGDEKIPLKEFRNAFISHFGLEEEEIDLVNDSMLISKTISGIGITGKMVMSAICEINGCFGNIGRNGKFRYIYLQEKSPEIHPSNDLYPSNGLYPLGTNAIEFSKRRYMGSPTYEDYLVQKISKLQIRMEENDIGVTVGEGDNTYVIQDNFLVYGMGTDELTPIANNILNAIKVVEYLPSSVKVIGNPCVEVGDLIRINTKTINIDTYVLRRILKGIQALTDTYTATGEEVYSYVENGLGGEMRRLKGKMNIMNRTLEETIFLITDEESGLLTQIKQNAKDIELRAKESDITGNYIVSKINLNSTTAKITARNIVLEGLVTANDNFKVLADGSIEAVNATLNGKFLSHSDDKTCYINDGMIVLFPERVEDPSTYEGDDYSVLSYDNIFINGSAYFNALDVGSGGITTGGDLTVHKSSATDTGVFTNNSTGNKVGLLTGASGNRGLYDSNNGTWIIYKTASGTTGSNNVNIPSPLVVSGALDVGSGIIANGAIHGSVLQAGNSGVNGGVEIYHATPFIDFHFGRSIADYTSRIIEESSGTLRCMGEWNVSGYCRTEKNFVANTSGHGLYGRHTDGLTSIRIAIATTSSAGTDSSAVNCTIHGDPDYRGYLIGASLYANKSITNYSDKRLKEDFANLDERYLDMFDNMQQELFKWKTASEDDRKQIGYVAQRVLHAMKQAGISEKENSIINRCNDIDNPEYGEILTLDYNALSVVAQYALKATRKQTNENTCDIQRFRKRIRKLERKARTKCRNRRVL